MVLLLGSPLDHDHTRDNSVADLGKSVWGLRCNEILLTANGQLCKRGFKVSKFYNEDFSKNLKTNGVD